MRAFKSLTPSELYCRWESQQWKAASIDLATDRQDWLGLSDQERLQWYRLAGFSHFRQSETDAVVWLSKFLPCLRRADQMHFLGTQIADEARHAHFFERFYREVISAALPATPDDGIVPISPTYQRLFIDTPTILARRLVNDGTAAHLAVAAFHVFILLEGSIALASFSVIRQILMKTRRFPGLLRALTFAQRDEVRHAQFGHSLLRDVFIEQPSCREDVSAHIRENLPVFAALLVPQSARKEILTSLGLNPYERRERAFALLKRNLGALALEVDAGPWLAAA